ncbi:hypothetical protein T069G_02736 [Trichoderma breve]|uniref:Nucleoside phosphorylase domain-containing protein n=1 Tax=Trichoderma breve TaxID=2034170 RepID=A0A9W9BG02_9HYPO|nr:hypothetical protein T069G_02736 [Trichoderma breve]KAJ4861782.1 hypothetical protein T069G_02736 [Trichoderma breve]
MEAISGATQPTWSPADYTVGWICLHPEDRLAATNFLDNRHKPKFVSRRDTNVYELGKIGGHNVVTTCLPEGGFDASGASAAFVAIGMLASFPNIKIGLVTGIGGAEPSSKNDIKLGDVVVGAPLDVTCNEGVSQNELSEEMREQNFQKTSFAVQSSTLLRTAVDGLKAHYETEGHQIEEAISRVLKNRPRLKRQYGRPQSIGDELCESTVNLPLRTEELCFASCGNDVWMVVSRPEETQVEDKPEKTQVEDKISIHYGSLVPGGRVMKDAILQDKPTGENDVLCSDTAVAGLMKGFPCCVIRGICDDSGSDKKWHGYAAMAAAAVAKDLLNEIPPSGKED